jgi:hypothetical protein
MKMRILQRCLGLLAIVCGAPTMATAGTTFFARMDFRPNSVLSAVDNASIQAKTSNRKGANGVLFTVKITGARDLANAPANIMLQAQTAWVSGGGCRGAIFPIQVVNGRANVKFTGTDVGIQENNPSPGRVLDLHCFHPFIYFDTGFGPAVVATFNLFSQTPGTILQAPFALSASPSNPITSLGSAKMTVRNVHGDIFATTTIAGAKEGGVPSSRAIVVLFPKLDINGACTKGFFLDQTVSLENGRGGSIRPNFDNGADDPGDCVAAFFGLTDSNLDPISDGLGLEQGTDLD